MMGESRAGDPMAVTRPTALRAVVVEHYGGTATLCEAARLQFFWFPGYSGPYLSAVALGAFDQGHSCAFETRRDTHRRPTTVYHGVPC